MNKVKKNRLILLFIICIFFLRCSNKNNSTQIYEIDSKYKFTKKDVYEFNKDSMYTHVELFYNKGLKDSVYTIGIKKENGYITRSRGWGYNQNRTNDWYYEKILDDQTVITDSVVNYVAFCDKNPRNTIKRFEKNILQRAKGYFYEIDMNKYGFVGEILKIKLNFFYDTTAYKRIGNELYIFKPSSFHNFCNASQSVVDSFPINNNSTEMRLLMRDKDKGKNRYLGYYYLIPKKQNNNFTGIQVFTEINFEVK